MKKEKIIVMPLLIILIATILGFYAQDIAYYFEDHLLYVAPMTMLTIVTVTSISLFILAFIIGIILLAKGKVNPKVYIILLLVNIAVGLVISFWSLFVLAMWWG